eukprot:1159544-Pelagomonas_calceolata.AAC.4
MLRAEPKHGKPCQGQDSVQGRVGHNNVQGKILWRARPGMGMVRRGNVQGMVILKAGPRHGNVRGMTMLRAELGTTFIVQGKMLWRAGPGMGHDTVTGRARRDDVSPGCGKFVQGVVHYTLYAAGAVYVKRINTALADTGLSIGNSATSW